jgi:hypothetical protein
LITFDNLFLNGLLININNPNKTDVNIKIGNANIGYYVNIPIIIPYISFLKYLININEIPNLLVFYIPR